MQVQIEETATVIEFSPEYQSDVERLVLPIQQIEFAVPITFEEQPDLMDIKGVFQKGDGNFWLAVRDKVVIGCVGIVDIGNGQVALKKMFVHRDFRGKQFGVSASLMKTAMHWCKGRGINTIFLGTTMQMVAAQRFYEKQGFVEVAQKDLPPAFPIVHVDKKFYRCDL